MLDMGQSSRGIASEARERGALRRDVIVTTAITLARAEGLGAVSMRRLAEALGASPMALYRHVTDREDLLLGMLDVVAEAVEPVPAGGAPRTRIAHAVATVHDALRRDPWVVQVLAVDGLASPLILPLADALFGALFDAGLPAARARAAYALLFEYVYGEVLVSQHARADSFGRRMMREADPTRFPHVARAVDDGSFGPEMFAENLERLLDGILAD